jgi:hypothetical protein
MCYTKKDRELEKEARRITESRLMEEEARHRHEDHQRRRREQTPDREGQGSGWRQVGRALGFCLCAPGVLAPGVFASPLLTDVGGGRFLRASP